VKRKFVIIVVSITAFLPIYFLIPVTPPIEFGCHSKIPPPPTEATEGFGVSFTMAGYTQFLLNNGKLYSGNTVCVPDK
jgi:hypothetical protein